MGNFGDDLRMERIARGMALEDITAVTKISQRHLVALEQERFRLLPGGILSKGIVRGYASALGLDQNTWTDRFLKACGSTADPSDADRDWTAFASNVGKARLLKREAAEMRMRWFGVGILAFVVMIGGFFTIRYYGVRAGWWQSIMPVEALSSVVHSASVVLHSITASVSTHFGS
jgi:cytoskeleton protein RodZ